MVQICKSWMLFTPFIYNNCYSNFCISKFFGLPSIKILRQSIIIGIVVNKTIIENNIVLYESKNLVLGNK